MIENDEITCSPEMDYYVVTSNDGLYEFKTTYQGLLDKFNNAATINYVMSGRDKYWSIIKVENSIDNTNNTFILF